MSETAIEVEKVSKVFGWRKRVKALDQVSLSVERGEILGLVGPNGAGKTTLLSCMMGFLRPDEGKITVNGLSPDALEVRRLTGYLPERVGFSPELSGLDFLRLHARLAGLSPASAREKLDELTERFGLSPAVLKRRLATYSRGMRQRVGMVQALLSDPQYLFLDEPASGLDPEGVILVRQAILETKQRGATVLFNSHQIHEVEKVCDRVAFLRAGRLERLEVLRSEEAVRYLLRTVQEAVTRAIAVLEQRGLRAEPFRDDGVLVESREEEVTELAPVLVGASVPILELQPAPAELESWFRKEKP